MPRRRKNLGEILFGRPQTLRKLYPVLLVMRSQLLLSLPCMRQRLIRKNSSGVSVFSDLDPDVVYLMLSECDFKR